MATRATVPFRSSNGWPGPTRAAAEPAVSPDEWVVGRNADGEPSEGCPAGAAGDPATAST